MKKITVFFCAVIAVAALAAFITLRWTEQSNTVSPPSAHDWLHQKLHLTATQHAALAPIEARFADRQQHLTAVLHQANRHLASVMEADKTYTPRVAEAVEQVHHCMGDLQKASVEHVFEMRSVLSEKQGEQLLTLARQALEQAP